MDFRMFSVYTWSFHAYVGAGRFDSESAHHISWDDDDGDDIIFDGGGGEKKNDVSLVPGQVFHPRLLDLHPVRCALYWASPQGFKHVYL